MKEIILTIAGEMNHATLEGIRQRLETRFGGRVSVRRDESLLGGFTVLCDGVLYDMSVASQLNQMKNALKAGVQS